MRVSGADRFAPGGRGGCRGWSGCGGWSGCCCCCCDRWCGLRCGVRLMRPRYVPTVTELADRRRGAGQRRDHEHAAGALALSAVSPPAGPVPNRLARRRAEMGRGGPRRRSESSRGLPRSMEGDVLNRLVVYPASMGETFRIVSRSPRRWPHTGARRFGTRRRGCLVWGETIQDVVSEGGAGCCETIRDAPREWCREVGENDESPGPKPRALTSIQLFSCSVVQQMLRHSPKGTNQTSTEPWTEPTTWRAPSASNSMVRMEACVGSPSSRNSSGPETPS